MWKAIAGLLLFAGCTGPSYQMSPRVEGMIRVVVTCEGDLVQYSDIEPMTPVVLALPDACDKLELEVLR